MAGSILEALLELDTEGTGFVGPKALRKMITQMGVEIDEETFDEILKESQKNIHGKISIQSFVTCMVGENSAEALKRMRSCASVNPSSRNSRMYSDANNEDGRSSANIPEMIVEEGNLNEPTEGGEGEGEETQGEQGEQGEVPESGNGEEEQSNEAPPVPEEDSDPKPVTENEEQPSEDDTKVVTELKSPTSPQPQPEITISN